MDGWVGYAPHAAVGETATKDNERVLLELPAFVLTPLSVSPWALSKALTYLLTYVGLASVFVR